MQTKNTMYSFDQVTDDEGGKLIITGMTSSIGVKYVELQYSKHFVGKSEKTCRREIEKLKSKNGGIQKRYWGRAIMVQGKTFISRLLFDKRTKRKRSKKSQTLIEGYIEMLSKFNWQIVGCVRYERDKTLEEIRRIMEDFNLFLQKLINEKFTLFYVVEPNDPLFAQKQDPHHCHYMIAIDEKVEVNKLKLHIMLHFLPVELKDRNSEWCKTFKKDLGYTKYCANKIKPNKDNYYIFSNMKSMTLNQEVNKEEIFRPA